jgi:DNA-binding response OmpR family regulator
MLTKGQLPIDEVTATPAPGVYRAGNIVLDEESRHVTVAGRAVAMTCQEFELLAVLVRNPGCVLPQAACSRALWGSHGRAQAKRLTVLMSRLRRKLTDAHPYDLQTIRSRGYGLLVSGRDETLLAREQTDRSDRLPTSA